jgi:hypothetical protein
MRVYLPLNTDRSFESPHSCAQPQTLKTGRLAALAGKYAAVGFVCTSIHRFRKDITCVKNVWFGGPNLNRCE